MLVEIGFDVAGLNARHFPQQSGPYRHEARRPDALQRIGRTAIALLALLLGGGLAWLIVAAAALWLKGPIGELAQLYSLDFALRPLALVDSLALLGAAAALGWLGAGLSLRQHLGKN